MFIIMKKRGTILMNEAASGWETKVVKVSHKELEAKLAKLREMPFSTIVIETGARHYGLPPDAKERRM
jgi:hypothetical protein